MSSFSSACVKEFVKSENQHGFGGEEHKEAKNVVDCKQACLAATDCAGLDFNNNDNSCWLLDAAHEGQIAAFTGVDHYKMEENCKATTTTRVYSRGLTTPSLQ